MGSPAGASFGRQRRKCAAEKVCEPDVWGTHPIMLCYSVSLRIDDYYYQDPLGALGIF